MTKKRRKVQVSIPIDEYDAIEKRWKSYGFSSVAEAARVMLMGDLNEHVKEMRRQVSAMEKMDELQAKKEKSKQYAKTKPERTKTTEQPKKQKERNGKTVVDAVGLSREEPKIEAILKKWLENNHIDKVKYDKAKGLRKLTYDDGTNGLVVWL